MQRNVKGVLYPVSMPSKHSGHKTFYCTFVLYFLTILFSLQLQKALTVPLVEYEGTKRKRVVVFSKSDLKMLIDKVAYYLFIYLEKP